MLADKNHVAHCPRRNGVTRLDRREITVRFEKRIAVREAARISARAGVRHGSGDRALRIRYDARRNRYKIEAGMANEDLQK